MDTHFRSQLFLVLVVLTALLSACGTTLEVGIEPTFTPVPSATLVPVPTSSPSPTAVDTPEGVPTEATIQPPAPSPTTAPSATPTPALSTVDVIGWYGSVHSAPAGSGYDDYLSVLPEGATQIGLVGASPAIESMIADMRDVENKYANFYDGYTAYILGNEDLIVTNSTASFGRALVEQQSGFVNITLDYRVRVMKTSTVIVNNVPVHYIDIWIIRLHVPSWSTYIHDFNLKARCLNVSTTSYGPYTIDGPVKVSAESTEAPITDLGLGEQVVFNLIVADVAVTF